MMYMRKGSTRILWPSSGRRRPEHLVETSARFQPCFEAGIRELPFLMPEPAEKPSLDMMYIVTWIIDR